MGEPQAGMAPTAPVFLQVSIDPYDFKSDFQKWMARFERFRVVSGLVNKSEEEQVHALVYLMGPEAEDIFQSFYLSTAEKKDYTQVISRF